MVATKNCKYCNTSFEKEDICSKKDWGNRKFCSSKCYGKSLQKKINCHGYYFEFNLDLKETIKHRDRYICNLCGKKQGEKSFHVHHIDYRKSNNSTSNLITLCGS